MLNFVKGISQRAKFSSGWAHRFLNLDIHNGLNPLSFIASLCIDLFWSELDGKRTSKKISSVYIAYKCHPESEPKHSPCPALSVVSWPAYRFLSRQVRWSGIPLFQNFPQFVVIRTVKGFGIVNKAEIDVFLELSCFFDNPADVGNLISGSSAFSKSSLNIWKFMVHILLKLGLDFWALLCWSIRWVQFCSSLNILWHYLS